MNKFFPRKKNTFILSAKKPNRQKIEDFNKT